MENNNEENFSLDITMNESRISKPPKPLHNSDKIETKVQIVDSVVREDPFGGHVMYFIRGKDKKGDFHVWRRYSDFVKLRDLMVQKWPGCLIPSLPPKKAFGNLTDAFIKDRKLYLELFCQKIAKLKHLQYSKEYQSFLRSSEEIDKALFKYQEIQYNEIVKRFQSTFSYLSGKEINNDTEAQISAFKSHLIKLKGLFEKYRKILKSFSNSKRSFYNDFDAFNTGFLSDYETNVIGAFNPIQKDNKNVINNPMTKTLFQCVDVVKQAQSKHSIEYVYEWIKSEEKEVEALLDAIAQREKIEQLQAKIENKRRQTNTELQNLVQGKNYFKTLFSKKSKSQMIDDTEKLLENEDNEINNLQEIHDLATIVLLYEEIERYDEKKHDRYFEVLRKASEIELRNSEAIYNYWKHINENKFVKDADQTSSNHNILSESILIPSNKIDMEGL